MRQRAKVQLQSRFHIFPPVKIGVDGGGTKTALILIDDRGGIVDRRLAPGCNHNICGPETAVVILEEAMSALVSRGPVTHTVLCMAGSPSFWDETAAALTSRGRFGKVIAFDDSRPVLELATDGEPGLVLHGGTGSFIAAQSPAGSAHYAGGSGWRFGDPGSGYDLGRRAIGQALLELQGWSPRTSLSAMLCNFSGLTNADDLTRYFYEHAEPNKQIAGLTPALLRLAADGDQSVREIVLESVADLLHLCGKVVATLFPAWPLTDLKAGASGPILTHPFVFPILAERSGLNLRPIIEAPIEGVRRLILRTSQPVFPA